MLLSPLFDGFYFINIILSSFTRWCVWVCVYYAKAYECFVDIQFFFFLPKLFSIILYNNFLFTQYSLTTLQDVMKRSFPFDKTLLFYIFIFIPLFFFTLRLQCQQNTVDFWIKLHWSFLGWFTLGECGIYSDLILYKFTGILHLEQKIVTFYSPPCCSKDFSFVYFLLWNTQ